MASTDSFPRQKARTRNFTLGEPRSFHVAADGSRITFLRSPAGDDERNALWTFDVDAGRERLVDRPGGPRRVSTARGSQRRGAGATGACA